VLRRWAAHLPLQLGDGQRPADDGNAPGRTMRPSSTQRLRAEDWVGRVLRDAGLMWQEFSHDLALRLNWRERHRGTPVLGEHDAAALIGFESPLASTRSVVALTANRPEMLVSLSDALLIPAQLGLIHGQVTLVEQGKVSSFDDGPSYYSGDVGLFVQLRFIFARHPLGLALLLSMLRRVAQRRLVMQDGSVAATVEPARTAAASPRPSPVAPAVPEALTRPLQP
jgi:hypothetical protein